MPCRILELYLQHRQTPASTICSPWPLVRLSTCGGRVLSHAGPSAWNALPVRLNNNELSLSNFRDQLKHFYTSRPTSTPSAFEVFCTINTLYKYPAYLLTMRQPHWSCCLAFSCNSHSAQLVSTCCCYVPEQNQMRSRRRNTARWSVPWVLEWNST